MTHHAFSRLLPRTARMTNAKPVFTMMGHTMKNLLNHAGATGQENPLSGKQAFSPIRTRYGRQHSLPNSPLQK